MPYRLLLTAHERQSYSRSGLLELASSPWCRITPDGLASVLKELDIDVLKVSRDSIMDSTFCALSPVMVDAVMVDACVRARVWCARACVHVRVWCTRVHARVRMCVCV